MRIGFDAKRAFNNTSGLGNYSRFIIAGLQNHFPQDQYYLYTPSLSGTFLDFYTPSDNIFIKNPTGLGKLVSGLWRSKGIITDLEKDQVQLYHGLSNELPYGGTSKIKKVVTIHDLIFKRYPELYKPTDRFIYNQKFKYACITADKIVAISEQTKSDIVDFFKIPADKIEVIYQDCNPIFHQPVSPVDLTSVKNKYQLPDAYILCVGTLEPRKNQLTLLKAWHQAGLHKDLAIVMAGRHTPYAKEIEAYINTHQLQKSVQFLPYINTAELPAIYQLASLFVYPSLFEGFGIPIIEALNSGVPVITSAGSCFSEAGGADSVYVTPNHTEELAFQLKKVLSDSLLRKNMVTAGYNHAQQFRPEKTITQLYNLYRQILNV